MAQMVPGVAGGPLSRVSKLYSECPGDKLNPVIYGPIHLKLFISKTTAFLLKFYNTYNLDNNTFKFRRVIFGHFCHLAHFSIALVHNKTLNYLYETTPKFWYTRFDHLISSVERPLLEQEVVGSNPCCTILKV